MKYDTRGILNKRRRKGSEVSKDNVNDMENLKDNPLYIKNLLDDWIKPVETEITDVIEILHT